MATLLRARNAALLAKIEAVEDTPETPSASVDAIKAENISITYSTDQIQTNEATGSLDGSGPIPVGTSVSITFDFLMRGSGTAGVEPEVTALMKACAWSETITAAAIPVAAEAATAGSATTATLGASFAATAQLYRGMPLTLTVNPATAVTPFISDYSPDGASKVATLTDTFSPVLDGTTECQIPPNVLYTPASDSVPSTTMEFYQDGVQTILAGCRGAPVFNVQTRDVGRISFTFQGRFVSQADVAVPTATYDDTRPPPFIDAAMNLNRTCVALQNFSIDVGNNVVNTPDPCAEEGYGPAQITSRNMTGAIDPNKTLVGTRDVLTDMKAATEQLIHARWGSVSGNRLAVTVPAALWTGLSQGDRDGILTDEIAFFPSGQDSGAFICFY